MTRKVLTTSVDTPIEEAARVMADNKVGGLPVLRDDKVGGIITETDLFKILLEMMGARQMGVRVSVLVPNVAGRSHSSARPFSRLAATFWPGHVCRRGSLQFRAGLQGVRPDEATLKAVLEPLALQVKDIRTC